MARRPRLQLCTLEDRSTPTAGLMDTSFGGGDGIALFGSQPGYYDAHARSTVVQPDGKTVLAGTFDSQIGGHALIFRLNVDGSLDTSFSDNGFFTSQFTGSQTHFRGLAIQPDGKLVATGSVRITGSTMVLTARFNPNGTLDNTFDGDGYTTTNFSANDENGYAIALDSAGKIVVVGDAAGLTVIRYTTNGTLDTSFSLDGIFNHQPGGYGAWGRGVAVQPDGKIIGVGGGVESGSPDKRLMLIRLNTNGTLDTSFNTDGIVTTSVPGAGETGGYDVAVLPDGRLTAVGSGLVGSYGQHFVARYLFNGSLDTTFDLDGRILFDLDGIAGGELHSVAVQGDGKVVAAGSAAFPNDGLLMRFDEDGMDDDFGVGNFRLASGVVYTNAGDDDIWGVAIAPDGRIVTTGDADGYASVIRYTGDLLATPDSYSVDEDASLSVDAPGVLANDPTPNASPRIVTLVNSPQHAASFSLNADGSFSYEPAANFSGSDSFTYYFTAGTDTSLQATVSITVNPTNDPPTANDDNYNLPRVTPLQLNVSAQQGVLDNDTDPENNTLHAILVSGPAVGTLDLNDDGSFTYDFPASLTTSVSFTYKVNDGTVDGTTATVTLTRPANQAPSASDDAFEYPFNPPFNLAAPGVLVNDTDPENDGLVAEIVSQPATGSVSLQPNGSFSYQYPTGFLGPVTFTYRVFDGRDYSTPATVTLNRIPNQPPIAVDDAYDIPVSGPLIRSAVNGVLANDSDPEGDAFTATLVSAPAIGEVIFNGDGSFTYAGPHQLAGSVTFTYQLSDANSTGNIATVTLTRENVFTSFDGRLYIYGSAESETLRLSPAGRGVLVEIYRASGTIRQIVMPAASEQRLTEVQVAMGDGDDRIDVTALKLSKLIDAGAGDDVVRLGKNGGLVGGGPGNDWISSEGGMSNIYGGEGNNFIQTSNGNDTIVVGDGNNTIDSGRGHDNIIAGNGLNDIRTGVGNDRIAAGNGGNFIDAGAGNDTVTTGSGRDWILGGAGSDVLDAGDGDDIVDGGAGNDLLVGGMGIDLLQGMAGNDILFDGRVTLANPTTDSLGKILKAYSPSKKVLPTLLPRFSVTEDTASDDSLFGGTGTDWFWAANDHWDRLDKEPMGSSV